MQTLDSILANLLSGPSTLTAPRILVLGMGGGCDVVASRGLAARIRALVGEEGDSSPLAGSTVLFGNCIGPRKLEGYTKLAPRVWRASGDPVAAVEIVRRSACYGTAHLEQSVTLESTAQENSSPLSSPNANDRAHLFVVSTSVSIIDPHKTNLLDLDDDLRARFSPWLGRKDSQLKQEDAQFRADFDAQLYAITAMNIDSLVNGLQHLKIDVVIGVDNGGDSLTGGADFQNDCRDARDVQVLASLIAAQELGVCRFLHVVFGPGCDGESSEEMLSGAFRTLELADPVAKPNCDPRAKRVKTADSTGQDSVTHKGAALGWLNLVDEGVIAEMQKTPWPAMDPSRTPALIIAAAEGTLTRTSTDPDGVVRGELSRHGSTVRLPTYWLASGLLVKWPSLAYFLGFTSTLPRPKWREHGVVDGMVKKLEEICTSKAKM
jgi:hypothetical protein